MPPAAPTTTRPRGRAPTRPRAAAATSGGPPPPPPPAHVLIAGAGIVGTSTAYFLAKAGVPRITLVDATGPAAAASGRAGGFLARDWCGAGPWGALAAAGFDLHADLAAELGADRIGYRRVSTLSAVFVAGKNATTTHQGGAPGKGPAPPAWLPGATRLSSMGTPATTAQVHPRRLTEALLEGGGPAIQVVRDEVTGLLEGGRVGAVLSRAGPVAADAVVLALGPWTGAFLRRCGGSGAASPAADVGGRRAHSVVLTPDPKAAALPGSECVFSHILHVGEAMTEPEVYPRPDGSVYVCGAGDAAPLPPSAAEVAPDPAAIAALTADAASVAPCLAGAPAAPSACFLPVTPSGLPSIGPLRPGVWVAAGHGCWGILTGPVTGREVAAWVMRGGGREGGSLVGAFAPVGTGAAV